MTIETIAAPKTGRIAGTLHRRGYVQTKPVRDETLPTESAQESDVADWHRDSGQADHESK